MPSLVEKWRKELEGYPATYEWLFAKAGVKLCADELEARDAKIREEIGRPHGVPNCPCMRCKILAILNGEE